MSSSKCFRYISQLYQTGSEGEITPLEGLSFEDHFGFGKICYEKLQGGVGRVFFDYDFKYEEGDQKEENEFKLIRKVYRKKMATLLQDYAITDGSYWNSSDDWKISFHLIHRKKTIVFKNTKEFVNSSFWVGETRKIIKNLEIFDCFDKGVYSNKTFRLPYGVCEKKKNPHKPLSKDDVIESFIISFPPEDGELVWSYETKDDGKHRKEGEKEQSVLSEGLLPEWKRKKILKMLNANKRAFTYEDWFKTLYCFKASGFTVEEFCLISQESGYEAYDEDACIAKWNETKIDETRETRNELSAIKKWCKEDAPSGEYEKFEIGSIVSHLLDNGCSHEASAHIFDLYNKDVMLINKMWWIYDEESKMWKVDEDKNLITVRISSFFHRYIDKKIKRLERRREKDDEKELICIKKARNTMGHCSWGEGVRLCYQRILAERDFNESILNNASDVFCFANGKCIDKKTLLVRDIRKEDYAHIHCGLNYDERNEQDIKFVRKVLDSIFEEEQLKMVLSYVSASLYGRNKRAIVQIHTGSGANGKSTLNNLIKNSFGGYHKTLDSNQFTLSDKDKSSHNSALAQTRYTRYVSVNEIELEKGGTLKTKLIKNLTSGDDISARDMFAKNTCFVPNFTMTIQCNDIPNLVSVDDGIKRRFQIVTYNRKFVNNPKHKNERKIDLDISKKLEDSKFRLAFLHILFENYNEWKGDVFQSEESKRDTEEYFEENNPIRTYVLDRFEKDESKIFLGDLVSEFNLATNSKIGNKQFARYLEDLGFKRHEFRSNKGICFCMKRIESSANGYAKSIDSTTLLDLEKEA